MSTLESISKEVKSARRNKTTIKKSAKELAMDMMMVLGDLYDDLQKYVDKGMDAPAKRARAKTKIVETLGKSFRTASVK